MFYHYKIHHLNCHWTLQMWSKINFTKGGRCWQPTYIMEKPFSIHICWVKLAYMMCRCEGALNQVLWKTTHTLTTYAPTFKKFTNFVESQGSFSYTPPTKDLDLFHMSDGIWLELVDTFAPITHCILVQVCSTSSCKQNWSSYSFVHYKVWN